MSRLQSAEARVLPFRSSGSVYATHETAWDNPTFAVTLPPALELDARLTEIQRSLASLLQDREEWPEYFRIEPLSSRRVTVRVRKREEGQIRLVVDDF